MMRDDAGCPFADASGLEGGYAVGLREASEGTAAETCHRGFERMKGHDWSAGRDVGRRRLRKRPSRSGRL